MNICIVAGARPNFMKVAPIVHSIEKAKGQGRDINYQLVYAGREDDPTLEGSLFDDLQLARPQVFLGVDCENLNELTGQVMSAFERYLQDHATDVVIVVDDLASTLATAIVTKKKGVLLAHLVAGTRSFDIDMPKEINRLVIDGLSDLLFTAGMGSNSIATREGAELSKIYMVGNILMDTLRFNHGRLVRPALLSNLQLNDGEYLVFTLNRKVLIANRPNLLAMVRQIAAASVHTPVVAPLRGAAAEAVKQCLEQLGGAAKMHVVEPLSYLEFGYLTAHAKGIVTDSGNVAEEATFNGVPCITLNSYTEHVETVKQGTNVLVGEDPEALAEALNTLQTGQWKHASIPDRWDGRSADRIISILLEQRRG
ncbi:UDP-N-acetyl glucosamine 2-epimerase [Hoylesella loescheii]|uniref:UDP-N-acetyl glucosamine 2-epimerase n=1 Tax=Hoylesella loescheii TaxID=840 RepID=UPI0026EBB0A9|nr:UDP-N-acetyl glucosamine 2-epimerase [Hoylesella loescheii]